MQASAKDGADGVLRDEDEGDRAEGDLHRHRHPAAEGGVQAGGERGLQVKINYKPFFLVYNYTKQRYFHLIKLDLKTETHTKFLFSFKS